MLNTDDREIVSLILKRDESGLAEASAKYGGKLTRLALSLLRDGGAAEECVSDAMLSAWNSIPPHKPFGYLFAYLGRLVRCRAIDRAEHDSALKRSAALVELTREIEEAIPSRDNVPAEAEAKELMELINGWLSGIPKRKRDIFIRRYWFMDSVKDIAKLTGSGESGVKMTLARLREELRAFLNENGYNVQKG